MTNSPFRINRIVWLLLGLVVIAWLLYLIRCPRVARLAYIFDPAVSWIRTAHAGMSGRPELKAPCQHLHNVSRWRAASRGAVLIAVIPPMIAEFGQFLDILPQLIRESRGDGRGVERADFGEHPGRDARAGGSGGGERGHGADRRRSGLRGSHTGRRGRAR